MSNKIIMGIILMVMCVVFIVIIMPKGASEKYSIIKDVMLCDAISFWECDTNYNLTFTQGHQPYYNITKEIIMPLGRFKLPGVNPPEEAIISMSPMFKFDKNTNESAYTNMHVIPEYNDTTDWNIAFYWVPNAAGAGNVEWCVEFRGPMTPNAGELITGTTNTYCTVDASSGTQYEMLKSNKISIPGAGTFNDDQFSFRVFRGADDPADTYDYDADLIMVTIYYQSNKAGEV